MAGKKSIPFKYKHFADSAPEESRSEESASNNEVINESKQKIIKFSLHRGRYIKIYHDIKT